MEMESFKAYGTTAITPPPSLSCFMTHEYDDGELYCTEHHGVRYTIT